MIKVSFVNFLSLLSEFDFEGYMRLIIKKEVMHLLFFMNSSLVIMPLKQLPISIVISNSTMLDSKVPSWQYES